MKLIPDRSLPQAATPSSAPFSQHCNRKAYGTVKESTTAALATLQFTCAQGRGNARAQIFWHNPHFDTVADSRAAIQIIGQRKIFPHCQRTPSLAHSRPLPNSLKQKACTA